MFVGLILPMRRDWWRTYASMDEGFELSQADFYSGELEEGPRSGQEIVTAFGGPSGPWRHAGGRYPS